MALDVLQQRPLEKMSPFVRLLLQRFYDQDLYRLTVVDSLETFWRLNNACSSIAGPMQNKYQLIHPAVKMRTGAITTFAYNRASNTIHGIGVLSQNRDATANDFRNVLETVVTSPDDQPDYQVIHHEQTSGIVAVKAHLVSLEDSQRIVVETYLAGDPKYLPTHRITNREFDPPSGKYGNQRVVPRKSHFELPIIFEDKADSETIEDNQRINNALRLLKGIYLSAFK